MKKMRKLLLLTLLCTVLTIVFAFGANAVERPDIPTGLSVYDYSTDSIELCWDYDYDADGYRIFVRQGGKWETLDDIYYENYYTVENLAPSTTYRFAVRAFVEYDGVFYWSDSFATISAVTDTPDIPDTPTGLYVEDSYADSIELCWDSDYDADGHRVFIRKNGKWVTLDDVDYDSYTVENLTASTNYRFAVRSYIEDGDKLYWSKGFATINAVTEDMADYFYASAEEYGTKVTLSWDKEKGASGYRVFQYVSGKWKKVKDVSKKYDSYTVENLEIGKTYYFAVRPYAKTDRGVVWGDLSNTCKIKTTDPYTVKITSCTEKEKSVALKWKQVEAATGYRVYMYTGGKWNAIKTLAPKTSTSYTVTGLKSDTKYTLAVRAYTKKNGVTTWHPLKSIKAITLPSESDLRLYRIAAYDKKFQKNYLLEMTFYPSCNPYLCHYDPLEYCYYARKNGYLSHNDCTFSFMGHTREIYDPNSKNLYYISDRENSYYRAYDPYYISVPWQVSSYREDYDVFITEFNGETVVCESFYDSYYGDYYECYFKAGELVGFTVEYGEQFEGILGGTYVVNNFTTNVPDDYFILPKGYKIYD